MVIMLMLLMLTESSYYLLSRLLLSQSSASYSVVFHHVQRLLPQTFRTTDSYAVINSVFLFLAVALDDDRDVLVHSK